jgi:hypothetical protein
MAYLNRSERDALRFIERNTENPGINFNLLKNQNEIGILVVGAGREGHTPNVFTCEVRR